MNKGIVAFVIIGLAVFSIINLLAIEQLKDENQALEYELRELHAEWVYVRERSVECGASLDTCMSYEGGEIQRLIKAANACGRELTQANMDWEKCEYESRDWKNNTARCWEVFDLFCEGSYPE